MRNQMGTYRQQVGSLALLLCLIPIVAVAQHQSQVPNSNNASSNNGSTSGGTVNMPTLPVSKRVSQIADEIRNLEEANFETKPDGYQNTPGQGTDWSTTAEDLAKKNPEKLDELLKTAEENLSKIQALKAEESAKENRDQKTIDAADDAIDKMVAMRQAILGVKINQLKREFQKNPSAAKAAELRRLIAEFDKMDSNRPVFAARYVPSAKRVLDKYDPSGGGTTKGDIASSPSSSSSESGSGDPTAYLNKPGVPEGATYRETPEGGVSIRPLGGGSHGSSTSDTGGSGYRNYGESSGPIALSDSGVMLGSNGSDSSLASGASGSTSSSNSSSPSSSASSGTPSSSSASSSSADGSGSQAGGSSTSTSAGASSGASAGSSVASGESSGGARSISSSTGAATGSSGLSPSTASFFEGAEPRKISETGGIQSEHQRMNAVSADSVGRPQSSTTASRTTVYSAPKASSENKVEAKDSASGNSLVQSAVGNKATDGNVVRVAKPGPADTFNSSLASPSQASVFDLKEEKIVDRGVTANPVGVSNNTPSDKLVASANAGSAKKSGASSGDTEMTYNPPTSTDTISKGFEGGLSGSTKTGEVLMPGASQLNKGVALKTGAELVTGEIRTGELLPGRGIASGNLPQGQQLVAGELVAPKALNGSSASGDIKDLASRGIASESKIAQQADPVKVNPNLALQQKAVQDEYKNKQIEQGMEALVGALDKVNGTASPTVGMKIFEAMQRKPKLNPTKMVSDPKKLPKGPVGALQGLNKPNT